MTKSIKLKSAVAALSAATLLSTGTAMAGTEMSSNAVQETAVEKDCDICDFFDLGKIYKGGEGLINSISFIGRYQGQYHWSDGNQAGSNDDWDHRRARAGVKIGFLNNFTFEGQFNLDVEGEDRFTKNVEDLTIAYKPNDDFYLIVGKQKAAITREWGTSSKNIITVERSQLVNQIVPDKIGGVVAGLKPTDRLLVEAGAYLGDNSDDWELPFDGGSVGASLRVGYDVTENTNIRADYFYADAAGVDRNVEDYEHIFSLNSQSDWDRMHLITDLIFAKGTDDQNHADAFGVVVMPYYDLTDKLEAVFRYTYSTADSNSGIRLQSRYERETALDTRGDNYHAFYGGVNYYICEEKLNLMTGIEYSTMDTSSEGDYNNWTAFTGIRFSF